MFNSLRYGSGRWVALALLVALVAGGGYFGYSKIMNAAGVDTPAPAASASPAPSESTMPDEATAEPGATDAPGTAPSSAASDPIKEPFISMPVPEGGVQPSKIRGDAKDGEVFIYVIIPGNDIKAAAAFYKKELPKQDWTIKVIEGERISFRMTSAAWSGDVTLSKVDETKMSFMGILKPILE